MEATEKSSVDISGVGSSPGGDYKRVTISGAGKIDGDVRAQSVRISGAGKATVRESETLDASMSGAGKVSYYGDPTVKKSISGVGKVSRAA